MAGRPKGTKQKYVDRERMWQLHLEGLTAKEIAEMMGHHPKTICRLIQDRKAKEALEEVMKG